jgi:hypothetical protein
MKEVRWRATSRSTSFQTFPQSPRRHRSSYIIAGVAHYHDLKTKQNKHMHNPNKPKANYTRYFQLTQSKAMASRAAAALRTAALQGHRRPASTAAAHGGGAARAPKAKPVGDYVPVYVALGMVGKVSSGAGCG